MIRPKLAFVLMILLRLPLFVTSLALLVTVADLHAQAPDEKQLQLAERVQRIAAFRPPELLFIHTSKDIYERGEDLWFKVSLFDAQYLIPSLMSTTLYLQLLEISTQKIWWQQKYPVNNGTVSGHLFLATSLPEGEFLIAAYTSWSVMPGDTIFSAVRTIQIVNDITKTTTTVPSSPTRSAPAVSSPAILLIPQKTPQSCCGEVPEAPESFPVPWRNQHSYSMAGYKEMHPNGCAENVIVAEKPLFALYPEGGTLIAGVPSKVAFTATGANGIPVALTGILYEDDTPLVEFESSYAGMGSFSFTPLPESHYRVALPGQPDYDLPPVAKEGFHMKLTANNHESLGIEILARGAADDQEFHLLLQSRGVVYGIARGRTTAGRVSVIMPVKGMTDDVAELLLYDSNLNQVASRLVYVNTGEALNITAELSQEIYFTRGKASLKVKVADSDGTPLNASLTISVSDKAYARPQNPYILPAHLTLTSQFTEPLYDPARWYSNGTAPPAAEIDLLMLTRPPGSYIWSPQPEKAIPEQWQLILHNDGEGHLEARRGRNMVDMDLTSVMAFSPNIDLEKHFLPVDSSGSFIIPWQLMEQWRGDYVYLKPFGPERTTLQVTLDDPFIRINEFMRGNQIVVPLTGAMEQKEQAPLPVDPTARELPAVTVEGETSAIIRGRFLGRLDSMSRLQNYICRHNILNCENHPNEADNREPVEGLSYRMRVGGQLVSVVYRQEVFTEEELLKLNNLYRIPAFYRGREFPLIRHDNATQSDSRDFRNTLLWEPDTITGDNGEVTLEFFCSDINAVFHYRIEATTADGRRGYSTGEFVVRRSMFTPGR